MGVPRRAGNAGRRTDMADTKHYRLRLRRSGELMASGAAALEVPFELDDDKLPKYALHWEAPSGGTRRISDAARYRGRRNRLRKRLKQRNPLFADDEYEREVASRPGYYGLDGTDEQAGAERPKGSGPTGAEAAPRRRAADNARSR